MALRTKVLEHLEQNPLDFFTLTQKLGIGTGELAEELDNLLKAGYITKTNDHFCLTDRGKEYLKVEKSGTSCK